MSRFATLPVAERRLIVEQVSARLGIVPVIVEKDFWVCWTLGRLFATPDTAPHVVFKGGTSLSKVFGAIDRFSEDIDLSISPAFVGADAYAFEALTSRARRDAAINEMQRLCDINAKDTIAPALEAAIRSVMGAPATGGDWLSYDLDPQTHLPVLYFHYPATQTTGVSYIRRDVKLELGSLTDQQPVGRHTIRPWIAEEFPNVFGDWQCEVVALELSRTFWEKTTILHAEHYRPETHTTPDRYARHYADVARLLQRPEAVVFLSDKTMLNRVADWKSRVFARAWARYDLAQHGSFRLVPPAYRLTALAADYATMRPMFLTEPPPIAQVMQQLAAAEQKINTLRVHDDAL